MDLNNEVAHNISAVLQLLNNTRVDQKLIHAELLNFRNEVSQNISVALGSLNLEQMFSEISLNFTNINDKIGNINENRKLGSKILINDITILDRIASHVWSIKVTRWAIYMHIWTDTEL